MGSPLPFREALQHLTDKQVMPTALGSAELQTLDAAVRRQSFFSARTLLEGYLQRAREVIASVLQPAQDERGVTVGWNPASARGELRDTLRRMGHSPDPDEEGTIKDLSSDGRLDLVVRTNTELAQGAGHFILQNDPGTLEFYPALELVRYDQAREPRDWAQRWRIAAQVAGDAQAYAALELHGRMIALKSSRIWQALGDGAGGYQDTLGNPYPPFAFNSGMWTEDVDRATAEDVGVLAAGATVVANPLRIEELFEVPA
jgi:hypothetical protein